MTGSIEWLEARQDGKLIKYAVTSEWLIKHLRGWAAEDANDIVLKFGSRDSYIDGRTDNIYENLEHENNTCNTIYQAAKKQNAVLEEHFLHGSYVHLV